MQSKRERLYMALSVLESSSNVSRCTLQTKTANNLTADCTNSYMQHISSVSFCICISCLLIWSSLTSQYGIFFSQLVPFLMTDREISLGSLADILEFQFMSISWPYTHHHIISTSGHSCPLFLQHAIASKPLLLLL